MFEHIGLLTYLYTRLDAASYLITAGLVVGPFMVVVAWLVYAMAFPSYYHQEMIGVYVAKNEPLRAKITRIGIIMCVVSALLKVAIPTKEDALLIGGVIIGANVAEKTINAVSESEMIGKVFEIVEAKIDQTLNDIKGTKNEVSQGQNAADKK